MVTVNDIYSMGGRPVGMVNVLASGDESQRAMIVDGIEKGCHKLRVPMLGGHLHPDAPAEMPSLSVAILGHARKLLRSHQAETGDDLVLAVDRNGIRGCRSVVSWDANSGKTPEELIHRLEALPLIAEAGLSKACKDISNAGILGTTSIFLENSGKGGVIDFDAIPKPDGITMEDWLRCFQSFGFILSVKPENSGKVMDLFAERKITARIIGTVVPGPEVTLTGRQGSSILFDFSRDTITGIRYPGPDA
jgi:selenophosphate synthetase-related protein